MKKTKSLIALSLITVLLLTGCGQATSTANNNSSKSAKNI